MGLNQIIKIGDKIKAYRKSLNLTQSDMAKKTGLPRSTYANYENNTREPNENTLNKICTALGISLSELLGSYDKGKNIDHSMPVIPEHFTDPDEAREYVYKHKIFGANGFRPELMSDEKILEFANALLEQMELLSYKYKK